MALEGLDLPARASRDRPVGLGFSFEIDPEEFDRVWQRIFHPKYAFFGAAAGSPGPIVGVDEARGEVGENSNFLPRHGAAFVDCEVHVAGKHRYDPAALVELQIGDRQGVRGNLPAQESRQLSGDVLVIKGQPTDALLGLDVDEFTATRTERDLVPKSGAVDPQWLDGRPGDEFGGEASNLRRALVVLRRALTTNSVGPTAHPRQDDQGYAVHRKRLTLFDRSSAAERLP